MIDNKEIERIRAFAAPIFTEHGINEAYLYGSRARGGNTAESDYDFYCVVPEEARPFGISKFGSLIQSLNFACAVKFILLMPPILNKPIQISIQKC